MSGRRRRTYTYVKSSSGPLIRFRFKVVFIIFIIVTAVCFFIYMTGVNLDDDETAVNIFLSSDISKTESIADEPLDEVKEIINPVPSSEPLTETYFGKCAFVGDSITVGLSDYQLVPIKNVYAEIGMNIEKINTDTIQTAFGETTVLEGLKQAKPENIYIMLGSNGISWLSINEMISYYAEFVDSVKENLPDTNIYVLSIPPVTAERESAEEEPILNSDIDKYNSELLKMANDKSIYYVDINTALKGNDSKFPAENAAEDGMHFKKTTYSIMLDYILSHIAKQ